MATAADTQAPAESAILRIIRDRYGIPESVDDRTIFYRSRMPYYGSYAIDTTVDLEYARFLATGHLPDHVIRCSEEDVKYSQLDMNPP